MSFSVLFREFPADHLESMAAAISRARGISIIDATIQARRGWGFLERNATEEQARALVASLAQHGVAALAIPNDQLRSPQEPKVIVGYEADADGFTPAIQLTRHPTRHVRWDETLIVAAGGFSEEVIRRQAAEGNTGAAKMIGIGVFIATGIPMGLFTGKKKEEKTVKKNQFISFGQIVTKDLESFCFDPVHFNYAGLGAAKELNASLNFRALIREFARRTPARLNLGARLLQEGHSLAMANYLRASDFDAELDWLVNVTAAASHGPDPGFSLAG